ncbi:MAG: hypothetical protein JJU10_09390 [Idiomarina sp.]|nr:hypothetical protein [Idiomarina sp.]
MQGVVVVGCNIHDQMEGYILVGAGEAARSSAEGQLALPESFVSEENGGDWYLWHAWMLNAGQQPVPFSFTSDSIQLDVTPPPEARQSELESRFRRRVIRGGN